MGCRQCNHLIAQKRLHNLLPVMRNNIGIIRAPADFRTAKRCRQGFQRTAHIIRRIGQHFHGKLRQRIIRHILNARQLHKPQRINRNACVRRVLHLQPKIQPVQISRRRTGNGGILHGENGTLCAVILLRFFAVIHKQRKSARYLPRHRNIVFIVQTEGVPMLPIQPGGNRTVVIAVIKRQRIGAARPLLAKIKIVRLSVLTSAG